MPPESAGEQPERHPQRRPADGDKQRSRPPTQRTRLRPADRREARPSAGTELIMEKSGFRCAGNPDFSMINLPERRR